MLQTPDLARVAFLLIFPGFFGYQALAAFGAIDPVLGGGLTLAFGIALIALLPFAVRPFLSDLGAHAPFLLLVSIVAVQAVAHFFAGEEHQQLPELFISSIKLLIGWFGLYLVGYFIEPARWFHLALVATIAVMTIVTPTLIQLPAFSLDPYVRSGWNVASYQFFANAFAFTVLFALALCWKRGAAPIVMAAGLSTVFFLLGRSEQVGMLAVFFGWAVLSVLHRRARDVAVAVVGAGILLGVSSQALDDKFFEPPKGAVETDRGHSQGIEPSGGLSQDVLARQAEILQPQHSESWGERQLYFRSGWEAIKGSPLLGDYGGQIRDHGFFGSYIHNFLSVWRQYGLAPFLLFGYLTCFPIGVALYYLLIKRSDDPFWITLGIVAGYCLLLAAFTKSVYWPMPALAWGLSARLRAEGILKLPSVSR